MTEIVNPGIVSDMIDSGEIVIVDYFATWCGPCKMLHPVFDEVAQKYPNVNFVRLNVDEYLDFVEEQNVQNLPTIVAYKNGREIARSVGYVNKDSLIEFTNKTISL